MSAEVRLAVQRALDKLINRFGSTSDVIGELRAALAAMDKQEAKQKPVAVETEAAIPAVVEVSTAATETEAEPPPKKTRTGYGRKAK